MIRDRTAAGAAAVEFDLVTWLERYARQQMEEFDRRGIFRGVYVTGTKARERPPCAAGPRGGPLLEFRRPLEVE